MNEFDVLIQIVSAGEIFQAIFALKSWKYFIVFLHFCILQSSETLSNAWLSKSYRHAVELNAEGAERASGLWAVAAAAGLGLG